MNIRKLGRLDALIEREREQGKLQGATIVVEHKGKRVVVSGVVTRMNGLTSCYIQQY